MSIEIGLYIEFRVGLQMDIPAAGHIRAGRLLKDYLVCLHFTDGKIEAHDHTIWKKIIKAKVVLRILYVS